MIKQLSTLIAIGFIIGSQAQAADHEVSLELGTLGNHDSHYDLFGASNSMLSLGLRGGFKVHDRVSLIGSYHHHQRGAIVTTGWSDDAGLPSEFTSAYYADLVGLGVKADIQPKEWLQLYTSAQGLLYMGRIKLDSDSESRTNIGQVKASGISGGGQLVGGVEVQLRSQDFPIALGVYLEAGYALVGKHGYKNAQDVNSETSGFSSDPLSTMKPGGFVLRTGVGARF